MTGKIKLVHSGGNSVSVAVPTNAPSASEVEFKLPQSDGSADTFLKTNGSGDLSFSAVSAGITQADQWRITTGLSVSSATFLTSNWERNDTSFAYIGSGMSESSGVFTFPATGIYYVQAFFNGYGNGDGRRYLQTSIFGTTDNSSYSSFAYAMGSAYDNGYYTSAIAQIFFDVTNTSTHKVKMQIDADVGAGYFNGSTSANATGITFIRLGDT